MRPNPTLTLWPLVLVAVWLTLWARRLGTR